MPLFGEVFSTRDAHGSSFCGHPNYLGRIPAESIVRLQILD